MSSVVAVADAAASVAPLASAAPSLLTVPAAARLLGLSRRTLYDQCQRALFPSVRFGRAVRVRQSDVLRALLGSELEAGR